MSPAVPHVIRLPDGRFVVDSVELADVCTRKHALIGDAVRKALADHPDLEPLVISSTFRARNGRDYPCWRLGWLALKATFQHLENIPGRFDKASVLDQYEMQFLHADWRAESPRPNPDVAEPEFDPNFDEPEPEPEPDDNAEPDFDPDYDLPEPDPEEEGQAVSGAVVPFVFEDAAENVRFEVRAVDENGTPWFVRNDVCAALDLGNPSQATARLEADERGVITVETPGGSQRVVIISEPALFDMISSSRKPFARKFRRWVFHDVLPQIRKTGRYEAQSKFKIPSTYAEALAEASRLALEKDLADQRAITAEHRAGQLETSLGRTAAERDAARRQAAENQHAADILRAIAESDLEWGLTECADKFGIAPQKEFFPTLHRLGYLKWQNGESRACRKWVKKGFLRHATKFVIHPVTGNLTEVVSSVRVTGRGIAHFALLFSVGVPALFGQGVFDFDPKDPKRPH